MTEVVGTPRLELCSLTKSFGAVRAVRGVSLAIAPGEIHGLCGHNGAGKSTLINMLAGNVAADAGEILLDGEPLSFAGPRDAQRAGIATVDQELSLVPTLTVAENIVLGQVGAGFLRHARHARRRAAELLAEVGLEDVDPDTAVDELSIGTRQLVEIARALGREARLLILDEPTATLTEVEIERVFRAVRGVAAQGCAVIFVSHRLGEVLGLCDRVTVMRDGERVLDAHVGELSPDALVEAILGEHLQPAPHRALDPRESTTALTVESLAIPGRLQGFSATLLGGRVYGLAGQVGAGASDVLRALAGLVPAATGRVRLGERRLPLGNAAAISACGVGFVSGDRKAEGLFISRSILENLTVAQLGRIARGGRIGGGAGASWRRPPTSGPSASASRSASSPAATSRRRCSAVISCTRGSRCCWSTSRPAASTSVAAPRSTSCCARRRARARSSSSPPRNSTSCWSWAKRSSRCARDG